MTGNWHIAGAGAQGLLFYAYAQKNGLNWPLIVRTGTQPPSHMHIDIEGTTYRYPVHTDMTFASPIERLLVCVKATQLHDLVIQLRPYLSHQASIVFALNGARWWESVMDELPTQSLFALVSLHGSYRSHPWHVVDSSPRAPFFVGALRSPLSSPSSFATSMNHMGLPCEVDNTILARLWKKAAINCCVNPLTVLFNCRNGELLVIKEALSQIDALTNELPAVLATQAIQTSADELRDAVMTVCHMTARNYSSMHQDFACGREPEVEAIIAPFIAAAEKARLETPALHNLYRRIEERRNADTIR